MSEHEPIPYYENNYHDKLQFFGDAATLLLDVYGSHSLSQESVPINLVHWTDTEIHTSYQLTRFRPEAKVGPANKQSLTLKVTALYPGSDGRSVRAHCVNPATQVNYVKILEMTTTEREEHNERVRISKELMPVLAPGQLRILPPKKDDLAPEHALELLISVLARGLEILEQDQPDKT